MKLLRRPVGKAVLLLVAAVVVLNWTWGRLPDEPSAKLTKTVAGKFDQVAYFEPAGERAVGKQPVLMIHGLPGTHADWEALWPKLAGVRSIVVDRPGFGASDGETGSLREQAAAMHDLLSRLDARPALIVGHSYGGAVALALAYLYPNDVKALVLVGAAAAGLKQSTGDAARAWAARAINQPVVEPVTRALFGQASIRAIGRSGVEEAFSPKPVDGRYWQRFLESTTRPDDMRAYAKELLSFNDDREWLDSVFAQIKKPAVVIHGEGDKLIPVKFGRRIAATLRVRQVILPTGHMVQYSHSDDIAREIHRLAGKGANG